MCLEFPQFGYDVLSKFPGTFVPFAYTDDPNSPCPGREAQAREAGEDAPYSRQLPQAPPRIEDATNVEVARSHTSSYRRSSGVYNFFFQQYKACHCVLYYNKELLFFVYLWNDSGKGWDNLAVGWKDGWEGG